MKKIYSILCLFVAVAATVSCSDDDEIVLSTLNNISTFEINFEGLTADDVTYDLGNSITASVPFGTSLTALVPTIEIALGSTISPASGVAVDFVDGVAVPFTVTAEDGISVKTYNVTINVRGEVGSGSRLKSVNFVDSSVLEGDSRVFSYIYNESGFVSEITENEILFGGLTYTKTSFIYNDKNQITQSNIDTDNEVDGDNIQIKFTYLEGVITGSEKYEVEDEFAAATSSTTYVYGEKGRLSSKSTVVTGETEQVTVNFTYDENENVSLYDTGNEYTSSSADAFDDKNNPYTNIYPNAYVRIAQDVYVGGANNPTGISAYDNGIAYTYNADGYPLTADYSIWGFIFVTKTYEYYAE